MDHGTLTDNNGRKADFRNVVLVMTTNAGAQEMSRPSIGFTRQDHSSDGMEVIRRLFTPEFRNRLDAIVQFNALDPTVITQVVDKFIFELEAQLQEQQVTIEVDESARLWLAEHGYDPKMGARPTGTHYPAAHQETAGRGVTIRASVSRWQRSYHGRGRQVANRDGKQGRAGPQQITAPAQ